MPTGVTSRRVPSRLRPDLLWIIRLNYSRALRRPPGQSGPSPRGVGNETAFQKKKIGSLGTRDDPGSCPGPLPSSVLSVPTCRLYHTASATPLGGRCARHLVCGPLPSMQAAPLAVLSGYGAECISRAAGRSAMPSYHESFCHVKCVGLTAP